MTLRNFAKTTKIGDKEYPEYFYLTEIEVTENLKQIFQRRSDRYFPSNSKSDYEEKGRFELELILKENADIIGGHPEILSGNLKAFPKEKNNKSVVFKTSISILQSGGKYKTIVTDQKPKTTIADWLKKLFE